MDPNATAASKGGTVSGGQLGAATSGTAPPGIPAATSQKSPAETAQATSTVPCPPDPRCPPGSMWSPGKQLCIGCGIPTSPNAPPPGTPPPPVPTGGGCDCGQYIYEKGHKCYQICKDALSGGGACPENTPAGPATCCPTNQVYRTDTKKCEDPDARSKAGQETCTGPAPACPPGQGSWCDFDDGVQKCAPNGSLPAGGGKSGTGRTGGAPGGAGLSAEEKQMYDAITKLAQLLSGQSQNLFNVGFPAYTEAINYYRTLLGKGGRAAAQSAVAPSAEGLVQNYAGVKSAIGAGYLRGGAKDYALAEADRAQAGDVAHLVQGVQPTAANALVTGGLSGTQAGQAGEAQSASISGGLLSTQVQNRQFETSLKEQIRQFDISIAQQKELADKARAAGLQAAAMQADLARQQLELQRQEFEKQLAFQQQQSVVQQKQFQGQQSTGTGLAIGSMLVTLLLKGKGGSGSK